MLSSFGDARKWANDKQTKNEPSLMMVKEVIKKVAAKLDARLTQNRSD